VLQVDDELGQRPTKHVGRLKQEQLDRGRVPQHDAVGLGVGHDDGGANRGKQPTWLEVEPAIAAPIALGCALRLHRIHPSSSTIGRVGWA